MWQRMDYIAFSACLLYHRWLWGAFAREKSDCREHENGKDEKYGDI